MTESTLQRRNQIAAIICLIFGVLCFVAFNPGFLTSDSLDQYNQALTGKYEDWHPPLMAYTWHLLNYIHQGPEVMLVLQLVLLWTSVYFLATSFKSRLWYALIAIFALAPFVLNFAGNIYKDTQMAFAWLLAFSILFNKVIQHKRLKPLAAGCVLILILYGTWVRPNALPGAISLLVFLAWVVTQNKSKRAFATAIIAFTMLIVGGTFLFTGRIFHAQKKYAENKIFLYDLTGIFVKTGANVFPEILYKDPKFDTAYLRAKFIPATFDFIWWDKDNTYFMDISAEVTKEIKSAWKLAVVKYPQVYLSNRYEGFLYFLRIKKRDDHFYYASPWIAENKYGFKTLGRGFHEAVFTHVDMHEHMPYMQPLFWFLLNILLVAAIPLFVNKGTRFLFAALVFSALMYILPQFFIFQIDTEFRYLYWNCIACTIALFMVVYLCAGKIFSKKMPADEQPASI